MRGLLLAATLLATGCSATQGDVLTSVAADPKPAGTEVETAKAATAAENAPVEGYSDPNVVATGTVPATGPAGSSDMAATTAGEIPLQAAAAAGQPLAMLSTGVNATANPIYSTKARSGALISTDGGQQTQVTPVASSLYRSQPTGIDAQSIPQEGAAAVLPPAADASATELAAAEPQNLPLAATGSDETGDAPPVTPDTLALAALAAGKRKQRNGQAETTEVASLAFAPQSSVNATNPAAGKQTRMLYDEFDDSAAEEPAATEVAMLPGLARLAPNGLWLQTETVETGCFKPDLLNVLKKIEAHYGKKLVVTSGFRDPNRRVGARRHSLHGTCDAADIQLPGVGKWELASYLRNMPGRGGVGTYCHTESVHIDTGETRDWNWRCRRRAK